MLDTKKILLKINKTILNGGQLFKELVKKYGAGFVMVAITFDGYRRTVINDRKNKVLNIISETTAWNRKKN